MYFLFILDSSSVLVSECEPVGIACHALMVLIWLRVCKLAFRCLFGQLERHLVIYSIPSWLSIPQDVSFLKMQRQSSSNADFTSKLQTTPMLLLDRDGDRDAFRPDLSSRGGVSREAVICNALTTDWKTVITGGIHYGAFLQLDFSSSPIFKNFVFFCIFCFILSVQYVGAKNDSLTEFPEPYLSSSSSLVTKSLNFAKFLYARLTFILGHQLKLPCVFNHWFGDC